ncbi:MAG: hypothetical protein U9Q83_06410, partial [Bacteroidota bacterium]|nr:hypothetical protein [Bacteroidota bacterium]
NKIYGRGGVMAVHKATHVSRPRIYLGLKETVKKYNGKFIFLWHNSNLNTYLWSDYVDFYPEILK